MIISVRLRAGPRQGRKSLFGAWAIRVSGGRMTCGVAAIAGVIVVHAGTA